MFLHFNQGSICLFHTPGFLLRLIYVILPFKTGLRNFLRIFNFLSFFFFLIFNFFFFLFLFWHNFSKLQPRGKYYYSVTCRIKASLRKPLSQHSFAGVGQGERKQVIGKKKRRKRRNVFSRESDVCFLFGLESKISMKISKDM